MAKKFSIMDLMNDASRDEALTDIVTFDRVSVFDIEPNEKNEYSTEELENVKASIFAFGVQQPPLVVKQPLGSKYKYKAIAGHRRRLACIELVNEGYKEFEIMPVMVGENMDQDTQDALLVMTNSTQRVLSDWEKVMQHMKLKEIIPKMKKRQNMSGKTRSIESEITGVSEGQIAIYNTIGTKLNEWLMDWFKDGKIGISLAYEAAKLEPEQQEQLVEIAKDRDNFTEEDIKRIVGSRPIEGQLKIEPEKKVTESDTFEEEESPAAEKIESETVALRGGYDASQIDALILDYEIVLKDAIERKHMKAIYKYNCLLDALDLLKQKVIG